MTPEHPQLPGKVARWRRDHQFLGARRGVAEHPSWPGAASLPLHPLPPPLRWHRLPRAARPRRLEPERRGWGSVFFHLATSALSPSSRVAVQVREALGKQLAERKKGCLEEPGLCR